MINLSKASALYVTVLRVEPWAPQLLGRCSTPERHPFRSITLSSSPSPLDFLKHIRLSSSEHPSYEKCHSRSSKWIPRGVLLLNFG